MVGALIASTSSCRKECICKSVKMQYNTDTGMYDSIINTYTIKIKTGESCMGIGCENNKDHFIIQ